MPNSKHKLQNTFLCILLAGLSLVPKPALAQPISQDSANNRTALKTHYENLVDKHAAELALFQDLPFSDPDYQVFAYFKNRQIVNGFENKVYPDALMSRAEFVHVFAQIKKTSDLLQATARSFTDTPTNSWYARSLKYVKELGLVSGYPDGSFHPEETITHAAANKILSISATINPKEILSRRAALKLIYQAFPFDRLYSKLSFANPLQLKLTEKEVVVNGKALRGLFVNYLSSAKSFDATKVRADFVKIRQSGFIGINSEISWNAIESQEGQYKFPAYFDQLIQIAAEEGLYFSVLLAPHYTPGWVFEKYGDIRLYDNNGQAIFHDNLNTARVPEGAYLTFSPSAPAVDDQIRWQQAAVKHYKAHRNLLAVFLTNEQAFLKDKLLDYSSWAKTAWREWLKQTNLNPALPPPVDPSDPNFFAWQRFRQDTLTNYFNKVYRAVKQVAPNNLIIAHKILFYESTASFALQYGLRPSALELAGDIVANDIYGFAPNVYAAQNSFRLPKMIVETNLLGESWNADSLYYLLLYHYLQGVNLQGIFRWDTSSDGRSMFNAQGKVLPKTTGAFKAALLIRDLPKTLPVEPPNLGIIIPLKSLSTSAWDYQEHQHKLDRLHLKSETEAGLVSSLIWADNISVQNYYKKPDQQKTLDLSNYQVIYAPIKPSDSQAVNNEKLRDWVKSGGQLVLEPETRSLPNWLTPSQEAQVSFGQGLVSYEVF